MLLLPTPALAAANECPATISAVMPNGWEAAAQALHGAGRMKREANDGDDVVHTTGWRFRVSLNASAFVRIVIVTLINVVTRLLLWRSQIG
jgi:hypothetical protein